MNLDYYDSGYTQGVYYRDNGKKQAYEIYERFCKQPDWWEDGEQNLNKVEFIRGWTDAITN